MVNNSRWLFLFIQASACAYRCKHCLFAPAKKYKALPGDKIIDWTQPFVDFRDSGKSPYGNLAMHVGDCALNQKDLPALVTFMKSANVEGWQNISADGFRQRTPEEWRAFLTAVLAAGTQTLEFTLYGQPETHDWFAGRTGSYQAIVGLAELWRALGGKTLWWLFIHKRNLLEIEAVRDEICDRFQQDCPVLLWSYSGWGARVEALRIEPKDLEHVVVSTQAALSRARTEREWVGALSEADEPPFSPHPQVMRMVIDPLGRVKIPYTTASAGQDGLCCGGVPADSIERIMHQWQAAYSAWQRSYPQISDLCKKYGDAGNEKLYDKGSVIRKWSGAFEAESTGVPG